MISRHTVVCRVAQEAVVPPVSILTGRKKTQFSHLCSSVIPYPIGTKFSREVLASKGSLHTKFEDNRSSHFRDTSEQNFVLISSFFKPGARPQPAFGRLWACAWFTEIVFVKVCVCTYLPMFVRTYPREQNRLITIKAAFT